MQSSEFLVVQYYTLSQLFQLRNLVRTLILSWLDCCNLVLIDLPASTSAMCSEHGNTSCSQSWPSVWFHSSTCKL